MRLGAPVFESVADPAAWAAAHRRAGYAAAWLPIDDPDDPRLPAYIEAARQANLVIAEVGAWSNPISPDDTERKRAIALCCSRLELAERAGARCCVNIAGSRSQRWDGPHPDNLAADTFDLIVRTVREIIDAVKPSRTFYTLETMPWIVPDSPESYLALIHAIDRQQFAVHLDPVNLINSPRRYYRNGDFIRACFETLGPHIRSCHGKDIILAERLTVHLDECRPGLGALDYRIYLRELSKLDPDMPLMLEHQSTAEDYTAAAEYVRQVAAQIGIRIQ